MGVYTYWIVVAIVIVLGLIMPQRGEQKKYYIIIVTAVQTFVCAFRYMYLTGDLRKYAATYYELPAYNWFDKNVWQEGRNAGYAWLMKVTSQISNGNFQVFLILLAVFTQVALAILIYKYSPKPWLSYVVWNCMAFYITYDFTSIKQGLAMAILMFAMNFIMDEKPIKFLITTLIAGFIHVPALCFLPAYFLMKRRVSNKTVLFYIFATIIIWTFRGPIVDAVTEMYYAGNEELEFIANTNNVLGGRFFVVCLILLAGIMLKGFREKRFEGLFNIILVAAIFQMFAIYDNVFTRLADYYLQFSVLFIPMIFYNSFREEEINRNAATPMLPFNERSMRILVMALTVVLIWWYYQTCIGVTITNPVDDYTNFRFMWDVIQ